MVPKEEYRLGIDHLLIAADMLGPENGRHRRDVLVAETDVRSDESLVAGDYRLHPYELLRWIRHPVAGDDLLGQGHGPRTARHRRDLHLPLQAGQVVLE